MPTRVVSGSFLSALEDAHRRSRRQRPTVHVAAYDRRKGIRLNYSLKKADMFLEIEKLCAYVQDKDITRYDKMMAQRAISLLQDTFLTEE